MIPNTPWCRRGPVAVGKARGRQRSTPPPPWGAPAAGWTQCRRIRRLWRQSRRGDSSVRLRRPDRLRARPRAAPRAAASPLTPRGLASGAACTRPCPAGALRGHRLGRIHPYVRPCSATGADRGRRVTRPASVIGSQLAVQLPGQAETAAAESCF